ncbi:hypothetical protein [Pseudofrankia inefficax]|uniref:Uncharacterized protein n=1 Tax=Pseudofrankia inefficax (strain DSM 45817 / CECT 9037 / DDB 130130 / EuI1c) TaxID=298654 RepID=E3J8I8_PSEI1|nr:hypothetical protein [Pseudofrankia inefficax]ADP84522.1 hypothetical protein FraEuI1c_6546 [Pseudofrankia inefficax]
MGVSLAGSTQGRVITNAVGWFGRAAGSRGDPGADRLLGIYLNDHLAGSTAGLRLARRLAEGHDSTALGPALASISREIDTDRAAFIAILTRLGISRRRYKMVAGWLAEFFARAKANGRILRRSPLSSVVELEMLRLGVEGKSLGWQTLRTVALHDPALDLDSDELDVLASRARHQASRLEELRTAAIREALSRNAAHLA